MTHMLQSDFSKSPLCGTRFEIMPFERREKEAAARPRPTRLTVTCSPTYGIDHGVQVATRLRALGHSVTAHVAARMLRDLQHLGQALRTLASNGVNDIFVIARDTKTVHGPFPSAVELLPVLRTHAHAPRFVGIAGYPEGHRSISSGVLLESLRAKSRFADYITTQLCFDAQAVLAWVQMIRREGIELPCLSVCLGLSVDRRCSRSL
jgi:methylenetetrahydrofolate reductase (NADPH)